MSGLLVPARTTTFVAVLKPVFEKETKDMRKEKVEKVELGQEEEKKKVRVEKEKKY